MSSDLPTGLIFNAEGLPPRGSLFDRNRAWRAESGRSTYTSTRAQSAHPCSHLRLGEGSPLPKRLRSGACPKQEMIIPGDIYLLAVTPENGWCISMGCAIDLGIVTYGTSDQPLPAPTSRQVFKGVWACTSQIDDVKWLWEWAEGDLRWEVTSPGYPPLGADSSAGRYATREEAMEKHWLR